MNVRELEDCIYAIEGFTASISSPNENFKDYFVRPFPGNSTLSKWKARFIKKYPNSSVAVQKGNGENAHGNILIENLRSTYDIDLLRLEIDYLKNYHADKENGDQKNDDGFATKADPYEVLGVEKNCPFSEVRYAYGKKCDFFHDDKLRRLGLHEELLQFALQKMQAINSAYAELKALRTSPPSSEEPD
ncbi:DnaJ family molecular chaperone [Zoogloea sp.]|uniref:J domain-containing protein n=1 Tax=Zoogloea sp. TaxID=49181 RepID=UPI0035AD8D4B